MILSSILHRAWLIARSSPGFVWKHKVATVLVVVIGLPILGVVWFALSPTPPEYVTETAKRGDLRQTVEAVGTVISERDLNLQFGISGIVESVLVKEGDTVNAGQRLAQLRGGNYAADIASAQARVAQAEADLREMESGARPEDIAVTEADVENKRASLATAKTAAENARSELETLHREIETSLTGYVGTTTTAVSQRLTVAQNSLSVVDDIFSNNDVLDAAIKDDPGEFESIRTVSHTTRASITPLFAKASSVTDPAEALKLIEDANRAVESTRVVVDRSFAYISSLQESSSFSNDDRESYKADLIAERNTLQTALSGLSSDTKSLRDAAASYESQIVTQQAALDRANSDITTYEASLRISEAQLALKKAPARDTDLASARAVVQQYRAALARAAADYANTIIVAPVSGVITKVPIKVGEYTPTGSAITMLGESPYRIEMYVSEIDIPKIQLSQSGSVKLDAFPGEFFPLRVSQIDSSSTDRDGVSKYRVRLDFLDEASAKRVKLGMTGDAIIITGFRTDIVYVPTRSVLERDDETEYVRVLSDNGDIEERTVQTGMEGEGSTIEVLGVEQDETVIVLVKE